MPTVSAKTPMMHRRTSISRRTAITDPKGHNIAGASVLLNFQDPIPRAVIAATPTADNIQTLPLCDIPGTISMVVIKSRKTRVVMMPKPQYNHSRVLPSDDPVCIMRDTVYGRSSDDVTSPYHSLSVTEASSIGLLKS